MTILPFRVYAYGAAGVAILGAFFWLRSHYIDVGQERVRAEVAAEVAKATAETARIDAERAALAQRIESDLLPKLDAASKRGDSLAKRLWAYTHSSPLPQAPGSTPSPDGPGGVPGSDESIGRRTEEVFAACARDATRLDGWIEFYSGLAVP